MFLHLSNLNFFRGKKDEFLAVVVVVVKFSHFIGLEQ